MSSRPDRWRALAHRLGLLDGADAERMLRTLLNLEGRVGFGPIYYRQLGEGERLFLFEYDERLAGGLSYTTSVCLVTTRFPLATFSLKASRKLHAVLELLGASAVGGERVTVPEDAAFNDRVTVYAREEGAALELLSPTLRGLLEKALCTRGAAPTFLLGERHLLFSHRTKSDAPTNLETLELLSSDLLDLYAALKV